jgi:uncharacterized cupredoxin-like copper-binding protein
VRPLVTTALISLLVAVGAVVAYAAPKKTVRESEKDFSFSKPHPTVSHGKVKFKLKNKGSVTHSFKLVKSKHKSVRSKNLKPGKSTTVKVRLSPGTYTFYCPIDGHRSLGMKGKVKVK